MIKTIKIVFLSIIIVVQCACKSEPVEIKLNLEEGKEYIQNMITTLTAKTLFSELSGTYNVKMSLLIEKVFDTAYLAKVQYRKVAWNIQTSRYSETFDSESSDNNDFKLAGYKVFTNTAFNVTLLKNGKALYIDESETWDKIDSSLTELSLEQKEEVMKSLKGMAKAFIGNLEKIQSFYPNKSVIKDEKWELQTESNLYSYATTITEYQLLEVKEDYFNIKEISTLSINKMQDVEAQSEIEGQRIFDIIEAGTSVGEIKIDRNTGWIIEANQQSITTGRSNINNMEVPMEVTKNIKITNQ